MVWRGEPGTGFLTLDGSFTVASANNILVGAGSNVASGQKVMALANVPTEPSSLGGIEGGVMYVNSGRLYYLGSQGTKTELGTTPVPSLAAWNLDTGSSSTPTVTKPTGTASGDTLLSFMNLAHRSSIVASGWIEIDQRIGLGDADLSYSILRLIAGGSEPANYSFISSAAPYQAVTARITGAGITNPLAGAQVITGASSDHTPEITPERQFSLIIGALGGNATKNNSAGAPTNPTWTTLANTEQNNIRILFGNLTDGQKMTTTLSATFLFTDLSHSAAWLIAFCED